MAFATQEEADSVVARCNQLISIHGAHSDTLAEVRKWYQFFERRPEHGSLVVLEAEITKVENLNIKEHHASSS
jgi:hypothetical protein